jgi:hypothetical protein
MRPRIRAIITLLFVTAFLVTAPVVLLVTSGYRYNWKRQRIQKTGIIQIETTPEGAAVAFDGIAQKKTTPAAFTRLLPQDYRVTVEKPGFLPWEKTLEVRSGETTFATGIVLYKEALPRLVIDADVIAAAWTDDGTDVAYLAHVGGFTEVLTSIDGETPRLLSRVADDAYPDPSLAWSPEGDAVLLTSEGEDATRAVVFLADGTEDATAIHESFPKGRLVVRWSADGDRLGVASADGAFSVDRSGEVSPVLLDAGIHDVALRGRNVYVLRERRDAEGGRHGDEGAGPRRTSPFPRRRRTATARRRRTPRTAARRRPVHGRHDRLRRHRRDLVGGRLPPPGMERLRHHRRRRRRDARAGHAPRLGHHPLRLVAGRRRDPRRQPVRHLAHRA